MAKSDESLGRMTIMIGKLICMVTRKHKRGRRVSTSKKELFLNGMHEVTTFACPRCGAQWTRARKITLKTENTK